ncbi:MAG: Asr1405/Asl0597 family protein [Xenococcaceae cyanobacterium]
MSLINPQSEINQVIEVNWADRWEVYHRLQALQIPCQCLTNQPLQVQLHSITAAIQLWSVVRHLTVPRYELVHWLERCWQMKSYKKEN